LLTANARAMVTRLCGSLARRPASLAGDPIMNEPAGMTTISGQLRQSWKVSPARGGDFAALWPCARAGGDARHSADTTHTTERNAQRLIDAPVVIATRCDYGREGCEAAMRQRSKRAQMFS